MSFSEKLREHEGKKLGGPQMKRLLCCASHRRETLVSLTARREEVDRK